MRLEAVVVRFRYATPLNNSNPKLGAMTNFGSGPNNGGRSLADRQVPRAAVAPIEPMLRIAERLELFFFLIITK